MQNIEFASLIIAAVAIALLPFAAMVVTSYTKIVVVLGLLRNALGVQQVPPSMVLNGIAMIVSCFVMAPVGMEAMQRAHVQLNESSASASQVMRCGVFTQVVSFAAGVAASTASSTLQYSNACGGSWGKAMRSSAVRA